MNRIISTKIALPLIAVFSVVVGLVLSNSIQKENINPAQNNSGLNQMVATTTASTTSPNSDNLPTQVAEDAKDKG